MRKFAEQWLSTEMQGKNLRNREKQVNAKAYANSQFKATFTEVFASMSPSALTDEAPYGFVKWVHEAMTARAKGDSALKRESTEPIISPAVISPAHHSTSGQPHSSISVIKWVHVIAFEPSGRSSAQIRLSMDSTSQDAPLSIVPAVVAVRYLSFDRMNESFQRFGLLNAEKTAYVPREDTSFQDSKRRRLITNDSAARDLDYRRDRGGLRRKAPAPTFATLPAPSNASPSQPASGIPPKRSRILTFKVPKDRLAEFIAQQPAPADKDSEDEENIGSTQTPQTCPAPIDPAATSDDVLNTKPVEKPNPMFDSAAESIPDPGEGGNDAFAEESKEQNVHFIFSNEFLAKCEYTDEWPNAARFIKKVPELKTSVACVDIPGMQFPLFQYQWLGAYTSFLMCHSDRNGGVVADEMGMGKTIQMIALITSSGSFASVYLTPHHNWRPTDGHFQIIAPPGMIGTWKREWKKFSKSAAYGLDLELVVAHASLRKGAARFSVKVKLLDRTTASLDRFFTGPTQTLPPFPGDEHCVYREVDKRKILAAAPTGPYVQSSQVIDSSRLVVLTSYYSWKKQVLEQSRSNVHSYSTTPKAAKFENRVFRTVTPGMIVVDEAHICQKPDAGHYAIISLIDSMTSYTVKKMFLSGTPIRKGPGDLIAMIGKLESLAWNSPGHFLSGLIKSNLTALISKFNEVTDANDLKLQEVINGLAPLMPLITLRRTNESTWFGLPLRPPVASVKQIREVNFPIRYVKNFQEFTTRMRKEMSREKTSEGEVSKSKIISTTRLYRMAVNNPALVEFWNQPGNAQYRFLSTEMQDYLYEDGTLSSRCPLKNYATVIRANSPKLDFIGTVLDSMTDPSTGKLIVVTEFLESAWSVQTAYTKMEGCLADAL
ncbi:MAG: hypothetical protein Q9196_005081 [Gyalolechia fulgens]